jgi:hypothetical protein
MTINVPSPQFISRSQLTGVAEDLETLATIGRARQQGGKFSR